MEFGFRPFDGPKARFPASGVSVGWVTLYCDTGGRSIFAQMDSRGGCASITCSVHNLLSIVGPLPLTFERPTVDIAREFRRDLPMRQRLPAS
jgi:hypothetical protein